MAVEWAESWMGGWKYNFVFDHMCVDMHSYMLNTHVLI